ncbi:MAG: hypothetical protein ACOX2X_02275 [Peptococcia bacterium]|jgi:hypothetical protein
MKKYITIIMICSFLGLAMIPGVYSAWGESLQITGTVQIGEDDIECPIPECKRIWNLILAMLNDIDKCSLRDLLACEDDFDIAALIAFLEDIDSIDDGIISNLKWLEGFNFGGFSGSNGTMMLAGGDMEMMTIPQETQQPAAPPVQAPSMPPEGGQDIADNHKGNTAQERTTGDTAGGPADAGDTGDNGQQTEDNITDNTGGADLLGAGDPVGADDIVDDGNDVAGTGNDTISKGNDPVPETTGESGREDGTAESGAGDKSGSGSAEGNSDDTGNKTNEGNSAGGAGNDGESGAGNSDSTIEE